MTKESPAVPTDDLEKEDTMMRTKLQAIIVLLFAAVVLGAWIGSPCAQDQQKSADVSAPDQLNKHFKKAHDSFLKKDAKAAASEIRKAAESLKSESERATGEGKKALEASVRELEKLADDVEKGAVKSVKALDNAFARAQHALARHHYLKASESWAKKMTKEAGHDIKAAAAALGHGLAWTGRKVEAGTKTVLQDARTLAGKLVEGTGWVPAEVGKGIEAVGNEIEKLGKKIEPMKKQQ